MKVEDLNRANKLILEMQRIDETIEQKSEKYKDATKGTKYELKPGQEYAERTGAAAMKRN